MTDPQIEKTLDMAKQEGKKSSGKGKVLGTIAAVVVLLGIACAIFLYQAYYDRRAANFSKSAELYVYPDTTPDALIDDIMSKSGVKNLKSLKRAFSSQLKHQDIEPGHYTVSPSNSSMYVARMVTNGWQSPVNLVFSGSMRHDTVIAKKISSQMMLDSLDAVVALRNPELLGKYGFTPDDVFSLIIPDTYQVYWTESMDEILSRLKKAYDAFWTDDNLAKAKKQGLTQKQVSVLASIVTGETNVASEMPSIAGVYLNRLKIGMRLQADPTVAYLLGFEVSRILNRHLEIDSPSNTYMYAGLPPGPRMVPQKAALEAVLNPDTHGYLYFCASPDFNGTHRFAATYPEHLRNAREFQAALNSRR